jgi:hypothetical protein
VIEYLFENIIQVEFDVPDVVKGDFEKRINVPDIEHD